LLWNSVRFKAPGIEPALVEKPVELLSIFPTLIDLAGLPPKDDVDGLSIAPLMRNPQMEWNHPVITAHWDEGGNGGWQSVRTDSYRYIRYIATGDEELYDHVNDPEEWTNLIKDVSYKAVKEEMAKLVPQEMTELGSWEDYIPVSAGQPSRASSENHKLKINSNGFSFILKDAVNSSLAVYDVHGRLISDVTRDIKTMGNGFGSLSWPGGASEPGVYLIKFNDGRQQYVAKHFRSIEQ